MWPKSCFNTRSNAYTSRAWVLCLVKALVFYILIHMKGVYWCSWVETLSVICEFNAILIFSISGYVLRTMCIATFVVLCPISSHSYKGAVMESGMCTHELEQIVHASSTICRTSVNISSNWEYELISSNWDSESSSSDWAYPLPGMLQAPQNGYQFSGSE